MRLAVHGKAPPAAAGTAAGEGTGDELDEDDVHAARWERRFEVDAARVDELVELYTSLGYEVRTRAVAPQAFGPQCASCALSACSASVELSTRRAR
ncbi:MAG: hypothetical protein M0Z40_07825 [Actinomycetota bacterium]|jgi:hypothetical protein|nr:hypothetical protein [Actinomycetota bacterium]MDA8075125.1 hypothetical protein [Actinomycetota bacterium]